MMQDSMSARAGKNLKRIIKEKGFTQEQFAEQMYVDPTTVRRWLAHGIKDIDTISTIAEIFDIDVMDILKQGVFLFLRYYIYVYVVHLLRYFES